VCVCVRVRVRVRACVRACVRVRVRVDMLDDETVLTACSVACISESTPRGYSFLHSDRATKQVVV